MSATAGTHYIQVRSCAVVRGRTSDDAPIWGPPEYLVWQSDVNGMGKLLLISASRDAALEFARQRAATENLLIYEKPHKLPMSACPWTVH